MQNRRAEPPTPPRKATPPDVSRLPLRDSRCNGLRGEPRALACVMGRGSIKGRHKKKPPTEAVEILRDLLEELHTILKKSADPRLWMVTLRSSFVLRQRN